MVGDGLLPFWTRHWDPSTQLFFYYNTKTGCTTWEEPVAECQQLQVTNHHDRRANAIYTTLDPVDLSIGKAAIPVSSSRVIHPSDVLSTSNKDDDGKRKDYILMAHEYASLAPFRDPKGQQACVVCQLGKAWAVFFPCTHKCVCRKCCEEEGFSVQPETGWNLCPVCW
ncbi:unnamed protein product [Choristocarpus tenellus]